MKIEQKDDFKPISIILETKEEANMFYSAIEGIYKEFDYESDERLFFIAIANALSEKNF